MEPRPTIVRASAHPIAAAQHAALLAAVPAASRRPNHLIHLLLSFGPVGVFLVSVVDSSFVPLPIPGITDIMIVVLAAQHADLVLLIAAATAGSFLGGLFSYHVGQSGGMAFLEKHVPARFFKPICSWMESHAILSVALPAVLPPPMPLSPFVLAAGALNMPRKKFLTTFTLSRCARHAAAAAIGVYFGPHVVRMWNIFTRKWGVEILIVIWTVILISVAFAFWKIYQTNRSLKPPRTPHPQPTPAPTQG
jgi:membrane protein YqaA with SNARE-associated domain